MTTARVSAAAQLARPAVPAVPARKRAAPTRQRISTAVLVVGTICSLGSLFGPDWALRAGVVIALASAIASCALAWRELYLTKRRHAQDLLAVGRRHTEELRAERAHNADVLDIVSDRARRWRLEVDRQQTQIAGLRAEVTALGQDLSSVRRRLVAADEVIANLGETVRERDIEIALLRSPAPADEAQLHTLPRRVHHEEVGPDRWSEDEGRTVLDFCTEKPALPNFEADRRLA